LKLVVAVGGASGAIYAKRLLDVLAALRARDPKALEVGLCFSPAGVEVYEHEVGPIPDYPFPRYETRDFRAPFASGSAGWDAMVVIPCSVGGLARIAHGLSEDLIGRAADVMLKERRKLVLVPRETPLSLIHLQGLTTLQQAGAVILFAAPGFYHGAETIDDLVDFVVARILDQLGLDNTLAARWGQ
jgi:flavin prenyltransferase